MDVLETASGGVEGIRREDADNRDRKSSRFVGNIGRNIAVSSILFDPSVVSLPNDCQNKIFNKKMGKRPT